jgi:peptidyl-prolyl cis-trans isomerase C
MRNCSFLLLLCACAPLAWPQAAAPASTPPAPGQVSTPPAQTTVKPHGPEAVASTDPNRIVATVDGNQITAKQALEMLRPFPPDQRKQYESNLPNLIQQIYMRVQLAGLAAKMNLDQQSPWKDQIAFSKENVLAQAYLAHLSDDASKGPAEDPKKYYDEHPDEFDQVKLSGIFVNFNPPGTPAPPSGEVGKTEPQASQKANEVEKKLKAGGDFAALARTESENPTTASKGGDLGTYNMGDQQIPPPLRTAIGKLQPGQYSEPVRVSNSYLILKLESRQKMAFADVQNSIAQKVKTDKSQSIVKQELEKYKIKVEDPDFFEASGARPVPTLQRPVSAPAQPAPEK